MDNENTIIREIYLGKFLNDGQNPFNFQIIKAEALVEKTDHNLPLIITLDKIQYKAQIRKDCGYIGYIGLSELGFFAFGFSKEELMGYMCEAYNSICKAKKDIEFLASGTDWQLFKNDKQIPTVYCKYEDRNEYFVDEETEIVLCGKNYQPKRIFKKCPTK